VRPLVPVAVTSLTSLLALTLTGCLSVDPEAPAGGPTEAGNASPLVEGEAGEGPAEEGREPAAPDGPPPGEEAGEDPEDDGKGGGGGGGKRGGGATGADSWP
jgi:hypothetical protein